jgi:hypothetical protein
MERVREIQGTSQLRIWQAAVSLRQLEHYHRKWGAVDMCIIAEPKTSMKSMHPADDIQASDQLHAVVIAASL